MESGESFKTLPPLPLEEVSDSGLLLLLLLGITGAAEEVWVTEPESDDRTLGAHTEESLLLQDAGCKGCTYGGAAAATEMGKELLEDETRGDPAAWATVGDKDDEACSFPLSSGVT